MQQVRLTQKHRERALIIEENAAEREGRGVDWFNVYREAVKIARSEMPQVVYEEP